MRLKINNRQKLKILFHISIRLFTILVLMGSLVLSGCEDENEAPRVDCPQAQHVDNFRTPESSIGSKNARRHLLPYVGRDSFGIALGAEVEGIIETVSAGGDSSQVEISGTGQSALLGEIEFTQIHFVNLSTNEISGGRFTFNSENGETISGTYKGSRTPSGGDFTIDLKAKVAGGEVGCTPTALESGWGWINGSLTDGRADYQMDGWLFHHAEVNEHHQFIF